jgi:hypothetical protein
MRMREAFLASVLSQDIAFFDTDATTGTWLHHMMDLEQPPLQHCRHGPFACELHNSVCDFIPVEQHASYAHAQVVCFKA